MRLIVGLGNPGARYQRTRHNAGFMVLDELARQSQAGAWETRCQSSVVESSIGGQPVLLAKPLTFMNVSGRAVHLLLAECRLEPKGMILVVDDLNLPLGKIRIRERGSPGGHRGLESVARMLESEEFLRVRLGIGEENMPGDKAGFVLAEFTPAQEAALQEMIARAAQAVRMLITEGVPRAMSVFNA